MFTWWVTWKAGVAGNSRAKSVVWRCDTVIEAVVAATFSASGSRSSQLPTTAMLRAPSAAIASAGCTSSAPLVSTTTRSRRLARSAV